MILPPLRSTLFPYTTLFRSNCFGRPEHEHDETIALPDAVVIYTIALADDALHRWEFRNLGVNSVESCFSDRKSTRLNSSHLGISYAVFCLKKKKKTLSKINI